jgi:hypothetical protein
MKREHEVTGDFGRLLRGKRGRTITAARPTLDASLR